MIRFYFLRKGEVDPLAAYPNLKRLFETVDPRPVNDEETKRALFPSNYPSAA